MMNEMNSNQQQESAQKQAIKSSINSTLNRLPTYGMTFGGINGGNLGHINSQHVSQLQQMRQQQNMKSMQHYNQHQQNIQQQYMQQQQLMQQQISQQQIPQQQIPQQQIPQQQISQQQIPQQQMPQQQIPQQQISQQQIPQQQIPQQQIPQQQIPQQQIPQQQIPQQQISQHQIPQKQIPQQQIPQQQISQHQMPQQQISQQQMPQQQMPQHQISQQQCMQQQISQHQIPQHQIPQHQIPQHQIPQHQIPQHQIPQQQMPQQLIPQQQMPQQQMPQQQMPQQQMPQQQMPQQQMPQQQMQQQQMPQQQMPQQQMPQQQMPQQQMPQQQMPQQQMPQQQCMQQQILQQPILQRQQMQCQSACPQQQQQILHSVQQMQQGIPHVMQNSLHGQQHSQAKQQGRQVARQQQHQGIQQQQNMLSSSPQVQLMQQQYMQSQQHNNTSQQIPRPQNFQQCFPQQQAVYPNFTQPQQQHQNAKPLQQAKSLPNVNQQQLHPSQQLLQQMQLVEDQQNMQQQVHPISKQHQSAMQQAVLQQQQQYIMQQNIMQQDLQSKRLKIQPVEAPQQYCQQSVRPNSMQKLFGDAKNYSAKPYPLLHSEYGTLHMPKSLPIFSSSSISSLISHGMQQSQSAGAFPSLVGFNQVNQFSQSDSQINIQGGVHFPSFPPASSRVAYDMSSFGQVHNQAAKFNDLQQDNNSSAGLLPVGFPTQDNMSQFALKLNPPKVPVSPFHYVTSNQNNFSRPMLVSNNNKVGFFDGVSTFPMNLDNTVESQGTISAMGSSSSSQDIRKSNDYDTTNTISLRGGTDGDATPISVARLQQYLMKYLCECGNTRYSADFVIIINKKFEDYKRELITAAELKIFLQDSLGSELFKDLCADFRHKEGVASVSVSDMQNQGVAGVAANNAQLKSSQTVNNFNEFSVPIGGCVYGISAKGEESNASTGERIVSKSKESEKNAAKKKKTGDKNDSVNNIRSSSKIKSISSKKSSEKQKGSASSGGGKVNVEKTNKVNSNEGNESNESLKEKSNEFEVSTPTLGKSVRNIISPAPACLARGKHVRQLTPVSGGKHTSFSEKKKVGAEIKKGLAGGKVAAADTCSGLLNKSEKAATETAASVHGGGGKQPSASSASSVSCQREAMCTWGRNYLDRKLWDFPAGIEVLELVDKGKLAAEFRKVEALVDRADYLAALRLQAAKRNILNFLSLHLQDFQDDLWQSRLNNSEDILLKRKECTAYRFINQEIIYKRLLDLRPQLFVFPSTFPIPSGVITVENAVLIQLELILEARVRNILEQLLTTANARYKQKFLMKTKKLNAANLDVAETFDGETTNTAENIIKQHEMQNELSKKVERKRTSGPIITIKDIRLCLHRDAMPYGPVCHTGKVEILLSAFEQGKLTSRIYDMYRHLNDRKSDSIGCASFRSVTTAAKNSAIGDTCDRIPQSTPAAAVFSAAHQSCDTNNKSDNESNSEE